jgi:hypothetical protein
MLLVFPIVSFDDGPLTSFSHCTGFGGMLQQIRYSLSHGVWIRGIDGVAAFLIHD